MKIFSGSSNKPLAQKIAKHLDLELSPLDIFVFPDKEKRVRVIDRVVDEECIVVQSTSTPADTNYMELFLIIDALKRSGAKSVKVLIPYLGYQRQDHIFRSGEAVSLAVVAETLERVGMSELYTFDLHSSKIPENFKVTAHHLSALDIFSGQIKKDYDQKELVLVSPDMGGIRRIKQVSSMLNNLPFAVVTKNRNLDTGDIDLSALDGNVDGKTAIIVDDMIATGNTIAQVSDLLLENGATGVYVFATHAVFTENADKILQNSKAEKIYVSDTINIPKEKHFPKLEVLSIAKDAAKAILDTRN